MGNPVVTATDMRSLLDKARADTQALYGREVEVELGEITLVGQVVTDGGWVEEQVATARKKYPRRWQTHVQRTVVCMQTRRIEIGGVAISDDDGRPLTFTDPKLWELQKHDDAPQVHSSHESLKALLVSDMAISRAAKEFGADLLDDDEEPDPI